MTDDAEVFSRILLAGDGDLDEIRSMLRELGFPVVRFEVGQAEKPSVLISSARCALSNSSFGTQRPRFHIVVAERMSSGLRREIARVRPDFVLERPVDPSLLRLLIQHALYSGPERRRRPRVPLRASVRIRVGRTSRSASLIEISEAGCRLEARGHFERGQLLRVVLPSELTGARELDLEARVVGAASGAGGGPTSLAFLPQDAATRSTLRSLVATAAVGTGALRPRQPERVQPAPAATRARADEATRARADEATRARADAPPRPPPADALARRRSARGSFRRPILASGGGSAYVLVGRDLSLGGMRVDPDPLLVVGRELKLVIHASAGRPPVVVKAVVARDEGEEGCILRFPSLAAAAKSRLEAIVRELPDVHPADAGTRGPNVVVSEVVEL
jgi:hypothetical protein